MGANARRHMERHHTRRGSADAYRAALEGIVRDGPAIFRPAPPLAASDDRPAYGAVVRSVGQGLADLGIADGDLEIGESLARLLIGLDLDLDLDPDLGGGPAPGRRGRRG
jgi:hypothetical protein